MIINHLMKKKIYIINIQIQRKIIFQILKAQLLNIEKVSEEDKNSILNNSKNTNELQIINNLNNIKTEIQNKNYNINNGFNDIHLSNRKIQTLDKSNSILNELNKEYLDFGEQKFDNDITKINNETIIFKNKKFVFKKGNGKNFIFQIISSYFFYNSFYFRIMKTRKNIISELFQLISFYS